jgi:DNA-directed RNA polymerase subunit RPC12/RpoP
VLHRQRWRSAENDQEVRGAVLAIVRKTSTSHAVGGAKARMGDCLVNQFITRCVKCGEEFILFWMMDTNRVRPESIANVTCPVCGMRFNQSPGDLRPFEQRRRELLIGQPVRTVEVVYDCDHCGNEILVSTVHTDLPWEDLSREAKQVAVCDNARCPQRGLRQELWPTRVQLGALNPCW